MNSAALPSYSTISGNSNLPVLKHYMANLQTSLQIELQDPSKGPRPISIEDYRRRLDKKVIPEVPFPHQGQHPKSRGGRQVKLRKEIANIHRLLLIADKVNRRGFLRQLRYLKQQQKQHKQHQKQQKKDGNSPSAKCSGTAKKGRPS